MNKIVKEILLFFLLSFFGVWICFPLLKVMDLKASSSAITSLEEIYLIELTFIVWILVMFVLYLFRFLFYFLDKKFNLNKKP